jgi:serine/threonine-protein kinase HipA
MPGTLSVWLGDRRAGELTNLPGDYNVFSFDEDFAADPQRPVLSQSFIAPSGELRRVIPRTHTLAPPFFANLLPDEDTLLRRLLAAQHRVNRARDFPLLRVLGADLPGAVVIRDSDGGEEAPERSASAERSAAGDRPLRFSLAGVQLKFSAGMLAERLTIPLDGVGGAWIVKLPTNAFPRLPENEFAMMSFASAIGLDVPELRLVPIRDVAGLPHDLPALRSDEPPVLYAIARFDRTPAGSRQHVEDFNQIANQWPADKYDNFATHWIGHVVQTLCEPRDVDEFIRRVVFGIGIGNNDMHLKNWAVTYPDGRAARLAPLYDYVCTTLYYPNGALALTVGGEREFSAVGRAAIGALAARAELSVRRALIVADQTVAAMRDAWPRVRETIPDAPLIEAVERQFTIVPLMNGR